MLPMVTKFSFIERDMLKVSLIIFLHFFFAKSGHSFNSLDSTRVGTKSARPQRELGSGDRQQTRFWFRFCSKSYKNFSMFPMVTKLLLFARDIFEVPSNNFLKSFPLLGFHLRHSTQEGRQQYENLPTKREWSQMMPILQVLGNTAPNTSDDFVCSNHWSFNPHHTS